MTSSRRKRCSGFTLVELLVVIGIIALLISILIPTLGKARRQAIVTKCAAQLHNNGLAILNYAAANRGLFPQAYGKGNWPWDIAIATRDMLVKFGAGRGDLYCPSYPDQNSDDVWNYGADAANRRNTKGVSDFGAMGYFVMLTRPDFGTYALPIGDPLSDVYNSNVATQVNAMGLPIVYHDRLGVKNAAQLELMSDATLSVGLPSQSGAQFAEIVGGSATHHSTAHLAKNGREPEGGNVLFMDGHVSWRQYGKESNALAWVALKNSTIVKRRSAGLLNPCANGNANDPNGKNLTFWW